MEDAGVDHVDGDPEPRGGVLEHLIQREVPLVDGGGGPRRWDAVRGKKIKWGGNHKTGGFKRQGKRPQEEALYSWRKSVGGDT